MLERADKAFIVTLMQADGGFIENVQNAHQARADLRSQTDTLRFAAGKGCSSTLQSQIIQAHIDQELQACNDLLRDRIRNRALLAIEMQVVEESITIQGAHLTHLVNGLATHGDREDLRLQSLSSARWARNDGEVALQLLTLRIALRLLVFAHYRGKGALPLDEPVGVTSIDRGVIDPDLFLPQAFEQSLLDFFGHVLPRGVLVAAHMQCNGFKNLRVIVAALKRRNGSLRQRQRGIGDDQAGVDLFPAADTRTVRTGSVWSVETEVARLKLVHGMAVLRTGQCQREQILAFAKTAFCSAGGTPRLALRLTVGTEHLHKDATFRQLRCKLHRLGDTTGCGLLELHAIDHHINEVLDLLVKRTRLAIQLNYLAIDTNTAKALMRQICEQLGEFSLTTSNHRRHDDGLRAGIQGQDVIGHLIGGLLLDNATAFRAMGNANASVQQTKIIIYLSGSAHR